jgi:hypothetical protein
MKFYEIFEIYIANLPEMINRHFLVGTYKVRHETKSTKTKRKEIESKTKYPFLNDASFCPCFCFVHTIAQFSKILRFSHIYCQFFNIRTHD